MCSLFLGCQCFCVYSAEWAVCVCLCFCIYLLCRLLICVKYPKFILILLTNNRNVHFLSAYYHPGTLHVWFHQTSEHPSEVDTIIISLLQVRKQRAYRAVAACPRPHIFCIPAERCAGWPGLMPTVPPASVRSSSALLDCDAGHWVACWELTVLVREVVLMNFGTTELAYPLFHL